MHQVELLSGRWPLTALAVLLATAFASPALSAGPTVTTNQSYVEEVRSVPGFTIDDKMAVFAMVLGSLPPVVKVYPTENYFYFGFHYKGIRYAGNLRLDVSDRDKGLVHFNYFKDFTLWQRDETDFGAILGAKDGVTVTKRSALVYEIAHKGKTVRFELNDLSAVTPPADLVRKNETYIGPVFDESGLRFFLVFNEELKVFHYILDETAPVGDQFDPVATADRVTLGIRTGFAFYADRFANRKILVGVNQWNTSINNYLDGPFDQLPDNVIEGDVLKKAILSASPELEGQIDRLGNSPDGETRYLIAPYMNYQEPEELDMISQCAATEVPPVYYNCFSFAGMPPEDGPDDGTDATMDDGAPEDMQGEEPGDGQADDQNGDQSDGTGGETTGKPGAGDNKPAK